MIKLFKKLNPKPEDKTESLFKMILQRCLDEKATSIIFGVPTGHNYEPINHEDQRLNEVLVIPIWMKFQDDWHQVLTLPTDLLPALIEVAKGYSEEYSLGNRELIIPLETQEIKAILTMNKNFHYQINIEK
jgi:hypothetical protein